MLRKINFFVLVVLLIGILTLTIFTVATSQEEGDIYAGIKPLAEPVELSIAMGVGWHQSLPFYVMEQLGGFEAVGIIPKFAYFGNGPVMVEALNTWDMSSYGLGGIASGTILHEAVLLAASIHDSGSLQFFTRKDDPIVEAGKNVPECPLLYGTKETWKGREIYLPTGTTLHYTLVKGLEKFGLTDNDVRLTHMDVANANTALRAGRGGQIAGLWSTMVFQEDLLENFVPVIQGNDVGVELVATIVANPNSYKDPKKTLAIKKVLEMYFITTEWITENLDETCEKYFMALNEEQGVMSTVEEGRKYILIDPYTTIEETYKWATTISEDGKMTELEAKLYYPIEFFVKQGNFEPIVLDKLLKVFNTEYIEEIYEAKQK